MIFMLKRALTIIAFWIPVLLGGQERALDKLLSDSSMISASVSMCILNASTGESVCEYNPEESLMPASVLKLLTSAAAIELLGPRYCFKTRLGYTGSLNKSNGLLTGDIVIKGGGDPSLGSQYFKDHYGNFLTDWITRIKRLGIKKIEGRIIADDTRYDNQPVPPKWIWEDIGNYYGAGIYGLSVFDNMFEIHFRTSGDGTIPEITKTIPDFSGYELANRLIASGNDDNGYIFAAPYTHQGWISGTIPVNRDDFVLKASIPDPPLFLARLFKAMLDSAGITVSGSPTTGRLINKKPVEETELIDEVTSPPLERIIEVLNHESVNLYAEHLLKEMGKVFRNSGSTASGIEILYGFLEDAGINGTGIFLEDGSGMSPMNAITSQGLAWILLFMRNRSANFAGFYNSMPDAGREGTLKSSFKNPAFYSNLKAKSGSMTRVRSYAGFFKTRLGNEMVFSIIINNFSGPSQRIIGGIEDIILETILNR